MSKENDDVKRDMEGALSRRGLLQGGMCAATAVIVGMIATPASSQNEQATQDPQAPKKPTPEELDRATRDPRIAKKATQEKVAYQPVAKGLRRCADCQHYVAPESCSVVEGPINADGRCRLYIRRWGAPAGQQSM